jgi:hypothetical protein
LDRYSCSAKGRWMALACLAKHDTHAARSALDW